MSINDSVLVQTAPVPLWELIIYLMKWDNHNNEILGYKRVSF